MVAVPLSFLTTGVQTADNFSAGLTRMPLQRNLPAVIVDRVSQVEVVLGYCSSSVGLLPELLEFVAWSW